MIEAKMSKHRRIMKKKNKKTKKYINHMKIIVLSVDKFDNTEIKMKKMLYLNFIFILN